MDKSQTHYHRKPLNTTIEAGQYLARVTKIRYHQLSTSLGKKAVVTLVFEILGYEHCGLIPLSLPIENNPGIKYWAKRCERFGASTFEGMKNKLVVLDVISRGLHSGQSFKFPHIRNFDIPSGTYALEYCVRVAEDENSKPSSCE